MFSELTIGGSVIKALTIVAFFIAFFLGLNFYLKEKILGTALISILFALLISIFLSSF